MLFTLIPMQYCTAQNALLFEPTRNALFAVVSSIRAVVAIIFSHLHLPNLIEVVLHFMCFHSERGAAVFGDLLVIKILLLLQGSQVLYLSLFNHFK